MKPILPPPECVLLDDCIVSQFKCLPFQNLVAIRTSLRVLPASFSTRRRTNIRGFSVCTESATPHLTCQVFGTGSEWRTKAEERLCYQALASITACSGAQLPQSPLTGTPGVPALPTLGRKAYVLSVLEHQHRPRSGGKHC